MVLLTVECCIDERPRVLCVVNEKYNDDYHVCLVNKNTLFARKTIPVCPKIRC